MYISKQFQIPQIWNAITLKSVIHLILVFFSLISWYILGFLYDKKKYWTLVCGKLKNSYLKLCLLSFTANNQGGNKGPVQALIIIPSLNSMLSIFSLHHWSWEVVTTGIWSTLDTSFISIIVHKISIFCDSLRGFTTFLNQHLFCPCKCFRHSSFFGKLKN